MDWENVCILERERAQQEAKWERLLREALWICLLEITKLDIMMCVQYLLFDLLSDLLFISRDKKHISISYIAFTTNLELHKLDW